jgi:FkbM family methyltransferase
MQVDQVCAPLRSGAHAARENVSMDIKPLWTCQHIRLKGCREGAMIYTINDTYIGRALDKYGEISRDEVLFLQQLTRPGMTVLEVGANIGVFTVPLARFVHPGGRVIAFEPQRIMYQMLCGNIALNAIDNVVAHNCAAGRSSGSVAVPSVDYSKPGNFGAVSLARSSQGDIVPLVTIDSLALPSCHLIKVDVEGMELDVLEGASSTLRQFRPLLYVENDQPEKSPPLIAYLLALDYRLYWLEPPLYRSDNFFGDAENIFESAVSADMVCVPRSGPLAITVKNCVEITSPDAKRPGGYSRAPTS